LFIKGVFTLQKGGSHGCGPGCESSFLPRYSFTPFYHLKTTIMTSFNPSLLQANILKHHGRAHAAHIFLHFDKKAAKAIKKWIQTIPVTDAETQLDNTRLYNLLKHKKKTAKEGLENDEQNELDVLEAKSIVCMCFTATGLAQLGFSAEDTKRMDPAFLEGMKARKNILSDTSPAVWEFSTSEKQDMSAMILIANTNLQLLTAEVNQLIQTLPAGVTAVHTQWGEKLENEHGLGIEHFGYVDGISQPDLLNETTPGKFWNDQMNPLDVCLVNDPLVKHKEAFASYFVFRKLEQNVKAFKEAEEGLGLGELGGAYVVGRFESSTPVTKHKAEGTVSSEAEVDNNFNYDKDDAGNRCPYHAHIRAVNPRMNPKEIPNIRIVRRGLPYDEDGRKGRLEYLPEGKVGLLFMCFQKSIGGQFEVIQARWANKGELGSRKVGIDGIIGQGENNNWQEYPVEWNSDPKKIKCEVKGFVTLKGGDYFYAPSIAFFNNL
jgi:Dyp-type peroxidase family